MLFPLNKNCKQSAKYCRWFNKYDGLGTHIKITHKTSKNMVQIFPGSASKSHFCKYAGQSYIPIICVFPKYNVPSAIDPACSLGGAKTGER